MAQGQDFHAVDPDVVKRFLTFISQHNSTVSPCILLAASFFSSLKRYIHLAVHPKFHR
jgi:hypothetical protein